MFTAVAQDSALAALDEPLPAALLAFCADGWDAGRAAVVALAAADGDPDAVYRIGVPALLWAVHRRRAYLGPEDMWPVESSFVWSFRAEQVESGLDWDVEDMRRAISQESVTEQDVGRRAPGRTPRPLNGGTAVPEQAESASGALTKAAGHRRRATAAPMRPGGTATWNNLGS